MNGQPIGSGTARIHIGIKFDLIPGLHVSRKDNRHKSTDNTDTTNHFIPKESKALICFFNKLGDETKLQNFNLNDILKGSLDFT